MVCAGANDDFILKPAQPGETLRPDSIYTNRINSSTHITPGDPRVQVYLDRLFTFDVYSSS